MAVYTNLAVDCSHNESVARRLLNVYSNLVLETHGFGIVDCDVEHIKPNRHWGQPRNFSDGAGDWHTLCVSPNGIGNGLPLSESLVEELRPQLYEPLKSGCFFRSAWFGWKAQDVLGEMDWIEILQEIKLTGVIPNMPGLILLEDLISNANATSFLEPFGEGHLCYHPQPRDNAG